MVSTNKFLTKITLICLLTQSFGITAAHDQKQAQNQEIVTKSSRLYKVGLGLAGCASTLAAAAGTGLSLLTHLTLGRQIDNRRFDALIFEEYAGLEERIRHTRLDRNLAVAATAVSLMISGYAFKKLWDTVKKEKTTKITTKTA